MTSKKPTIKYTEQVLVIPADVCEIIERSNLLDHQCDDFALSFEIEDGKVKVSDLMEYVIKDYKVLEPEEAWNLVRKWWISLLEENKLEIAISKKQSKISELQNEIADLEKTKKDWRFWK